MSFTFTPRLYGQLLITDTATAHEDLVGLYFAEIILQVTHDAWFVTGNLSTADAEGVIWTARHDKSKASACFQVIISRYFPYDYHSTKSTTSRRTWAHTIPPPLLVEPTNCGYNFIRESELGETIEKIQQQSAINTTQNRSWNGSFELPPAT